MRSLSLILLLLVLVTNNCQSQESYKIIRISDYKSISFDKLINEISKSQIVFIGEQHSEFSHHKFQASVIEGLKNLGIKVVIGLEMFKEKDQKILDAWVDGKIDDLTFIKSFYDNWGSNWKLYKDIFLLAREKKIPLVGLNVPKEITKKVGEYGFQSLTKEELKNLPPNVTCEIDKKYFDLLRLIFQHKMKKEEAFYNFCEAQVLWDQAMAFYIDRYLKSDNNSIMVVLAGTFHAWKHGIPRQLGRFDKYKITSIIQDNPLNGKDITLEETDFLIIHQ